MDAGALGAEIVIGGRGVPSSRARSWRFYAGYLKKSGDISMSKVSKGLSVANLKSGSIGIKVRIMTPDIALPDKMDVHEPEKKIHVEEIEEEKPKKEEEKEKQPEKKEEKPKEKKTVKKTKVKKEEEKEEKPKKTVKRKAVKKKEENDENKEE
jgi:small subunit ribosomal protein S3